MTRRKQAANGARRGTAPWIALPWIIGAPLLACGSPGEAELTSRATSPIYAGVEDNDADQTQGVVALEIGNNGTSFTLCSGVLLSANVVLTARHCVSVQTTTGVACDANGVSATPPDFSSDQPASSILVFTGATPALRGTPSATATAIFHPQGTTLCNLDVALVVLDTPIQGVRPLEVRLDAPVTVGANLRAVGYGENDQNAAVGTRFRKDGVSVLAVGSMISASGTPLGDSEFEMGEAMCNGDSGGPVIDTSTGAVVGIVSRGGACTDATGHVYTALAAFKPLVLQAFSQAGGAPILEGTPYPADAGLGPPASTDDAGGGPSPSPSPTSSSGAGATPGPTGGGTVNLRSGAGQGCAAAPTGETSAFARVGLAALVALTMLRRRRAVK